jgi:lysyl-tRNA synthetase class 2
VGGRSRARARDARGDLVAVLHFVPWGHDGLSLDVMRRSPDCDNGVIELVVTELMTGAVDLGVARVSLNFAVFRSVFDRAARLGAGPVLRLWHAVLLRASRIWQLESLYRANAKYQPQWRPRYLCFTTARDLPRVMVAAMQAEAFLPRPRLLLPRPRLRPGRAGAPPAREPGGASGVPQKVGA